MFIRPSLIDLESRNIRFYDARPRAFVLDGHSAAIYAQARAMGKFFRDTTCVYARQLMPLFCTNDSVDWNHRNKFCPACGRRTLSTEAGHKRVCPPQSGPSGDTVPCISSKGVHNFTYPRTGLFNMMRSISS